MTSKGNGFQVARLQDGQQLQDLFGFAGERHHDNQIKVAEHAQVAVESLDGIQDKTRRACAGERGRDLFGNRHVLANTRKDNPSAIGQGLVGHLHRLGETIVVANRRRRGFHRLDLGRNHLIRPHDPRARCISLSFHVPIIPNSRLP